MTRAWFPSRAMIRELMSVHGFHESERRRGVFFRSHRDGRLQMVQVGVWSNPRLFARGGRPAPCNLAVRPTLDVQMPENVAWQAAQYADQHIALWFHGQDDWPAARELFASTIMPLLDAPAGGETLAVLGSWSPDAVESARAAREQMRDHLMPMP